MRFKYVLAPLCLLALALIPGDGAFGQRGGRGGGGGGRGGGVAAGGRATGAAAGAYGGVASGSRSAGTVVGPAGGSRSAGAGSGSVTTGRGTTVDYGGAGKTATGPGGSTAGRGVGGVQVTTPGGQTATKVGSAGGVKGPGGNGAVGARSVSGTTGPHGTGVSAARGGAAVGPGGAVGAQGRAGVGANPYGGYASASRSVAVSGRAGHYTSYRSTTAVRTQAGAVRGGFHGYSYFNTGWYTSHPHAWRAAAWAGTAYWRWAPYATIATFCGYPATPAVYDYGSTVVYEDNRVYYNGDPVATAEDYATQATDIAAVGQAAKPAETEEWQSLGVFAMVQGDEKDANNIFQLAINKEGVIRGNYHNVLTDTTVPVSGSVDKRSQRAAWIVGDNKEIVYETGLGNLAQPETAMLVHAGKDKTQQWTLVRLEPPADMK